ncbi:DUF808 domain-containing protein [Mobilicoccus pelagius]|uniref:Inner membrane protein YedI n=1 Tax=Mobilicoccus pelagius NBRC 104925 TaxID=1089455 RepID=H5UQQ2_9MICO|nr:DUF808 domain-containing protein [Mobilicoccus pelagius]GAB48060.1 hypothetical protein MOPEL_041_00030 [Mobilicoccus pelagius NBRC 104925]
MSAGLVALLDDIASLAKLAAASVDDVGAAAGRASAKAAGVVVDDTAVTPRYLTGFTADRELPAIKRITIGSLRNKLLFILPAALLLSQFAPWLLTPLLMLGGTYLSFEGAEKIWEKLHPHEDAEEKVPALLSGQEAEDRMVSGAIRTDFILSSEIMVIALNEVASEPLWERAIVLVFVAFAITLGVYGVVALIVKMDDIGLHLTRRDSGVAEAIGRGLVAGMPKVLAALGVIGTVAMLWVGGHILLVGFDTLGWHEPYGLVHHAEEAVHHATGTLGGTLGWLTNTIGSAIFGLVVGALVVGIMHVVPHRKTHDDDGHGTAAHGETTTTGTTPVAASTTTAGTTSQEASTHGTGSTAVDPADVDDRQ